jgi:hypothetical protein
MSANTSLAIRIGAIFDNRGMKKAETATEKLSKRVKGLAKTMGLALGAAGLAKFAKDSIKAFADEEKSIAMLSNALDNLGMGDQADKIYSFIDSLQMATGVSDDLLRPAFLRLAAAGLSATDAQSMLGLAMDVSAGTGKSLESVTNALAKAAEGNTAALSKLGVGLTRDELATMSLNDITMKLANTYKNAASKAADTFAGKMARLQVAVDTAKESIGKGLIDGLIAATGSASIDELQIKIINLGTTLATIFVATGNLIHDNWGLIKQLGIAMVAAFTAAKVYAGVSAIILLISKLSTAYTMLRAKATAAAIATATALNPFAAIAAGAALVGAIYLANKQLDKFEKDRAKSAKENPYTVPNFSGLGDPKFGDAKRLEKLKVDAAKAQTKAAKETLKQKQLNKIFDMQYIQIYAALQGKLSEEDRLRVQLQLALLDENLNAAEHLAKKLAATQGQTSMLATFLRTLPDAKNPFEKWGDYLKAIELEAKRIGAMSFNTQPATQPGKDASAGSAQVPTDTSGLQAYDYLRLGAIGAGGTADTIVNVQVTLDGTVVGNAVRDASLNDSLSGSFNTIARAYRFPSTIP